MDACIFLLTRIASTEGFIAVAIILLGYFIAKKKIRSAVALLATTTGLLVSVQATKELLHIPRPTQTLIEITGYAFPSGHAAGIAFLGLVIMYLARTLPQFPRYAIYAAAIISIIAIGISRVYFGVHTELQVLGGYLFGAFWAGFFIWLSKTRKR